MKKKITALLAGALLMASSAMALPFGPGGAGQLQGVLNGITVGGTSSVNAASDMLADGSDAYWHIGASGGSVASMVIELGSYAPNNQLYVYDPTNPLNKALLFSGSATVGTQAMLSIYSTGEVFVNFAYKGTFGSTNFGYAIASQDGTFYSDTRLNETLANGQKADHMLAYQGTGDTVKIGPFAAGPWGANEYILAFEDLYGNGADFNFTDMVVMVESVQPVPEPGTMVLLGAGLLGLAVFGKRRMNKTA